MSGQKPGRNDPCPCGSGKKYKKCCQSKEPIVRTAPTAPSPLQDLLRVGEEIFEEGLDRLDELSNSAVEAIEGKRYEEAENICEQLLRDYPQMIDGHDRLGMLRAAQGRYQEAADHCAKVLGMIEEDPKGFDQDAVDYFRTRQQEALAKATRQP